MLRMYYDFWLSFHLFIKPIIIESSWEKEWEEFVTTFVTRTATRENDIEWNKMAYYPQFKMLGKSRITYTTDIERKT